MVLTGYDDTLWVGFKKQRVKNDAKVVDLVNWKNGVVIY